MSQEIYKVQLSLSGSPGLPRMALIYNHDRSQLWEEPASDDLIALVKGEPKSFWYGRYDYTDKKIHLSETEAPWQNW